MALMDLMKMSQKGGLTRKSRSESTLPEYEVPEKGNMERSVSFPERGNMERSVSFGTVSVREFERILVVNPACTEGPSIGIGWNYQPKEDVSLSKWEKKRNSRRSKSDLMISQAKREKLAKKMGYSEEDIEKNILRVERLQTKREQTRKDRDIDPEVLLARRLSKAIQQRKQAAEENLPERGWC